MRHRDPPSPQTTLCDRAAELTPVLSPLALSQINSSKKPRTTRKRKPPACAKRDTTVPPEHVLCVKNTVAANREKGLNLKVWLMPSLILSSVFTWQNKKKKTSSFMGNTMTGMSCFTFSGSHDKDTVCEKCPPGTYSDGSSAFQECKKWTE